MNNFKVIYKILKYLESAMDYETPDMEPISAEQLRISYERWCALLILMQEEGYISGVRLVQTMSDPKPKVVEPVNANITLKGLEYLAENNFMKKAERALKGIKDTVPGW